MGGKETDTNLTCPFCYKVFVSARKVAAHKNIYHGKNQYICGTCDKLFSSKSNLVRHQMSHTGEKPYLCETCGKAFVEKAKLEIHELIHHNRKTIKNHEAPVKMFSTEKGKNIYKCDTCDKIFDKKHIVGSAQYGCNSIFQNFSGETKNFAVLHLKIAMY